MFREALEILVPACALGGLLREYYSFKDVRLHLGRTSAPIRPCGIRPTTPTRSRGWHRRGSIPSRTTHP